jgi:glycosyltransferase involved in cell wall biosynthesis
MDSVFDTTRGGISIAIPTYNGAAHIRECLESVLSQSCGAMEIVVCDGGSTDETVQIVREIGDPRIRIEVSNSRLPVEENWNRACALTRMEFVKLLCQDDLLAPGSLAAQQSVLRSTPAAVAVTGCRNVINMRGDILIGKRGGRGLQAIQGGREALRVAVLAGTNVFGEPSAVMFRGEALRRCLPWSVRFPYLLDLEMYSRVFQLGDVIVLPQVVASFRVHADSWSVTLGRQQCRDFNAWTDWVIGASLLYERRGDRMRSRARARLNQAARSLVYRLLVRP